jgi:hypothetical protein
MGNAIISLLLLRLAAYSLDSLSYKLHPFPDMSEPITCIAQMSDFHLITDMSV